MLLAKDCIFFYAIDLLFFLTLKKFLQVSNLYILSIELIF